MKTNDKLQDWLYTVPVTGGRQEFYTTYSFEADITFILADFFREENDSQVPDSTSVYSLYYGVPDEEHAMACIAQGEKHTIYHN